MLTFSKPYAWEGDHAVIQVLVFTSQEMQEAFLEKYNAPTNPKTIGGFPDENNLGAVFKMRAVKNGKGRWDAVVRCGFTGALLTERKDVSTTPEKALEHAFDQTYTKLSDDLSNYAKIGNDPLPEQPQFN